MPTAVSKKKMSLQDRESAIPIIADSIDRHQSILATPTESLPPGGPSELELIQNRVYMSVRISHVATSLEELKNFFFPLYEQVIICEESATKAGVHYHLLLLIPEKYVLGSENKLFRKDLKLKLPLLETPRSFSCSVVEKVSYVSYILKDGKYVYKGFDDETIALMAGKSYKKYDKTVFAVEWDSIRMNKELPPREKVVQFIKLKRKYNQNIKYATIEELLFTFDCDNAGKDDRRLYDIVSQVQLNLNTKLNPPFRLN